LALKTAVLTTPLPLTAQALALAGGCQLMIRMNEMPEKMILLEIAQFCCLKKKSYSTQGIFVRSAGWFFSAPWGLVALHHPTGFPLHHFQSLCEFGEDPQQPTSGWLHWSGIDVMDP
jgi:hypothetical protein